MNRHLCSLGLAGLLLVLTASSRPALALPGLPRPQSSDSKTDCGKQSDSKSSSSKNCDKDQTKAGSKEKSSKPENKQPAKEGDKISEERMSTRGLKPPPKQDDKDKTSKPYPNANPK
jgi:hypothetical protein